MSSSPRAGWRRLLVALGGAILLVYLAYLGGANWFLSSSAADRVINRKPEQLQLTWSRARSWLPGLVVLDEVRIEGANRAFDWNASIDHVWVQVSLWRLPLKTFHSDFIRGRGLDFRLRQHDRDDEGPDASAGPDPPGAPAAAAAPEAPPREARARNSPATSATPQGTTAPPARRSRDPWRIELDGIRIEDLREISIGESSLIGKGSLAGGLDFAVRGPLRFDVLSLSFADARLLRAGDTIGENVSFTIEASSAPFSPGEDTVREILGTVSGSATVVADVESIAALGFLFKKPEWLSLAGSGHLETSFRLRRGVVAPGGHLEFDATTLEARIADWTIDGGGTIAMRLPEGGPQAAVVDVDFREFGIRRGEREVAHVHGRDLRVALTASALDLERGLEDLDLRVDVPPSRVDFAAYTSYLPESPFRIERGQGTLESWFEYSEQEASGRGEVKIAVEGASGVAGSLGLQGDVELHTVIESGDLDAKSFDVSGSSLDLRNVRVTKPGGGVESEGWWATFATESARLDMKEPIDAEILVHGRMRDAKPFLTALAAQRKALFWIDELIAVEDVAGRARLDVAGQTLAAHDLVVTGRRLEVEGDIAFTGKQRDGLLLIGYGPFTTGLEMANGKTEWKLFRARRWFEERRDSR